MRQLQLSLSPDTIAAFKGKPSVGDSILRVLQMLAIVGAAFWTLYIYVTFGERSSEITLRLAELQELQSKASIKLTDLDARKRAIELARAEQNPVALQHEVTAVRLYPVGDGRFRYFITYNYAVTNVSDRRLNVDRVIVRGFSAATEACAADTHEVNGFATAKPVRWRGVHKQAYVFADWPPKEPIMDGGDMMPVAHGGGGTGTANTGEVLRGGVDILVNAKPSDLIGFKVRMRIGEGTELTDPRYMSAIRVIQTIESSRTARDS